MVLTASKNKTYTLLIYKDKQRKTHYLDAISHTSKETITILEFSKLSDIHKIYNEIVNLNKMKACTQKELFDIC
ncbi:MAG TPA: hypothetical protein ENH82_17480 [bacterium]|nr:hypothetical protein [bacterium]